jgi:hypothetical protein
MIDMIIHEIGLYLNRDALVAFLQTNKHFYYTFKNCDWFWKQRLKQDFAVINTFDHKNFFETWNYINNNYIAFLRRVMWDDKQAFSGIIWNGPTSCEMNNFTKEHIYLMLSLIDDSPKTAYLIPILMSCYTKTRLKNSQLTVKTPGFTKRYENVTISRNLNLLFYLVYDLLKYYDEQYSLYKLNILSLYIPLKPLIVYFKTHTFEETVKLMYKAEIFLEISFDYFKNKYMINTANEKLYDMTNDCVKRIIESNELYRKNFLQKRVPRVHIPKQQQKFFLSFK